MKLTWYPSPAKVAGLDYYGNDQAEKADGLEKVTPFKNGNVWHLC